MRAERQPQGRRLPRLQVAALLAIGALACGGLALACGRSAVTSPSTDGGAQASARDGVAGDGGERHDAAAGGGGGGDAAGAARSGPVQLDEDGNDDAEDPGAGAAPAAGRFEKVGTPPLGLTRICDLTPLGDALYAAHAHTPLGSDGATITKYTADEKKPFGVAFDWNRPGEPTKGGGAGQGFLRVHAIGGRLFVADADPPYNGLGLIDYGTEGYVFVSDRSGKFAPPRAPNYRPPATPDLLHWEEGRAGAALLPRAYHVIDVVRFRGALYASTGSVPPKERAWNGPSPGAMHRANDDGSRWTYEVDYPYPWQNGVWRLTFLVRFKDRLYAGIQDYDGRDPNDYVYFAPDASVGVRAPDAGASPVDAGVREAGPPPEPILRREDVHAVRVTRTGAAGTLRWWVDTRAKPARLYWIAWSRDTGIAVRFTTDGDTWTLLPLPEGAGRPTDVTRFRDAVVVLAERGLYRVSGDAVDPVPIARLDDVPDGGAPPKDKKSPFEVTDFFCAAPMAVFKNELYAGAQRGGALYKLVAK